MHNIKKTWIIPTLLTFVLLTAGGLFIGSIIKKENPLAASDIQTQVENIYGGKVNEMTKEGDVYKVKMTRNGATYSAEVDAVSGTVISLSQLSEAKEVITQPRMLTETEIKGVVTKRYTGFAEDISLNTNGKKPVYVVKLSRDPKFTQVTIDAITGDTISETIKEEPGKDTLITREQAIDIALAQLKPETVDEVDDVSYEKTDDGGFYLIEIDTKDNREVDFRIHAISGKIISVTWKQD